MTSVFKNGEIHTLRYMRWLNNAYEWGIFQQAFLHSYAFQTDLFFRRCNIYRRMKTGECQLCSRTRTCVCLCAASCCGHRENLGLQSKHKNTVAILTQDQITSESIRPGSNRRTFVTKSWKRERHFCYESECAILPFYSVFWSVCYQSGTPGGGFGLLPQALVGTRVLPLWTGDWNLKMSCNTGCISMDTYMLQRKKKKNLHAVLYRSKYSDIMREKNALF